jgi:menaquinone-dependent protoporphyrinogen oxidase
MDTQLRVLVCYASAAGSTREIAERVADRIATVLRGRERSSVDVTCLPAGPAVDLSGVDALVVGSAVHDMAWLLEATSLLSRTAGTAIPLWVFSVGSVEPRGLLTRRMAAGERARIERGFPEGIAPRDHRVFRGVVVMTGAPFWARLVGRLTTGAPGDHRDWAAIDEWARGIATGLPALSDAAPPGPVRS